MGQHSQSEEKRQMIEWQDDGPVCDHCGHQLSEWMTPEPDRSERAAMWVASHVASASFPIGVAVGSALWILVNVVWRPFEPYPVIVAAVTSAVLATVAALQGPLILTAQRRAAARDRLRDEETLRVTARTEADLHRVEKKLDRLIASSGDPG